MQVDDENPLAVYLVILLGPGPNFLVIESLLPYDSPPFSAFEFLSITIQRVDIEIDAALIADFIGIAASFGSHGHSVIEPVTAVTDFSSVQFVTLRWIEISPAYLVFTYCGQTRRSPVYGAIPGYFSFIPGLKSQKLLLPGIVMAHLTDRLGSLA